MLMGLTFTFGLMGAAFGTTPMRMLFDYFGYDTTFQGLAIVGLLIAVVLLLFHDKKMERFEDVGGSASLTSTLKLVFNPTILFIGVCGGLMVGALEGFTDLWIIPFFHQVYGLSEYESITLITFVYAGMCIGGPVLAFVAESLRSSTAVICSTGLLMAGIFAALFYAGPLPYTVCCMLMLLLGILCSYQVLVFTVTSSLVDKSTAGAAIGVVNCINMAFGDQFHKLISMLVQQSWNGALSPKGTPLYTLDALIDGLCWIPILSVVGALGFLYLAYRGTRKVRFENLIRNVDA